MSRRRSSGSTFVDMAEEFRRLPLVASVIAVAVVITAFELVAPWFANANQPATPSGFNYAKAFLPFVQIIG